MTQKIKEQILEVREDGRTNMLDINMVQWVANDLELYELVAYLIDDPNRKEYWHFIMTGEAPMENENGADDEEVDSE